MDIISLIGRDQEINKLATLLKTEQLILISGIAGIGKTSLVKSVLQQSNISNIIHIECKPGWTVQSVVKSIATRINTKTLNPSFSQFLHNVEKLSITIIIDNFHHVNTNDNYNLFFLIQKTLNNSKIIIVSRQLPLLSSQQIIKVPQIHLNLLEAANSTKLCNKLFFDPKSTPINSFMKRLSGHPSLIIYFSSLIKYGHSGLDETLMETSQFNQFMCTYLEENFTYNLNDNQLYILNILKSLDLPITKDHLQAICKTQSYEHITYLIHNFFIHVNLQGKLYLCPLLNNYLSLIVGDLDTKSHFTIAESFHNFSDYNINYLLQAAIHYKRAGNLSRFCLVISEFSELQCLALQQRKIPPIIGETIDLCKTNNIQALIYCQVRINIIHNEIRIATDLIRNISNDLEKKLLTGFIHFQLGEYTEAVLIFEHYMQETKIVSRLKTLSINLSLSSAYVRLNDINKAETIYNLMAKDFENNHYLLALIFYRKSFAYSPKDSSKCNLNLQKSFDLLLASYSKSQLYASVLIKQCNLLIFSHNELTKTLELIEEAKEILVKDDNYKDLIILSFYQITTLIKLKTSDQALIQLETLKHSYDLSGFNLTYYYSLEGTAHLLNRNLSLAENSFYNLKSSLNPKDTINRGAYLSYFKFLISCQRYDEALKHNREVDCFDWASKYPIDEALRFYYLSLLYDNLNDKSRSQEYKFRYHSLKASLSHLSQQRITNSIEWYNCNILFVFAKKFIITSNYNIQTMPLTYALEAFDKYRNKDLMINFLSQEVFIDNQPIPLASKKKLFKIILELAIAKDHCLNSADLYEKVWLTAYNPDIDGSLKSNINRLRNLFKCYSTKHFIISPSKGVYSINPAISFVFLNAKSQT